MMNLEKQRVLAAKAVLVLGGALVLGYAILVLLATRDRIDRPRLERVNAPSAQTTPAPALPLPR